jgi:antirestriction protein ArdC
MPELSRFESAGAHYSTLFHELGHWTRTKDRLDRSFGVSSFGNEAYSKEELCVELAAIIGGQRLGFCSDHFENHAAHIGSWLKVLKSDTRFLFTAAAHAQRIVDYLVAASEAGAKASEVRNEAA